MAEPGLIPDACPGAGPPADTLRARLRRASIYGACAVVAVAGVRSIYDTITAAAPAGVSSVGLAWWYARGPLMMWVAWRCTVETFRAPRRGANA